MPSLSTLLQHLTLSKQIQPVLHNWLHKYYVVFWSICEPPNLKKDQVFTRSWLYTRLSQMSSRIFCISLIWKSIKFIVLRQNGLFFYVFLYFSSFLELLTKIFKIFIYLLLTTTHLWYNISGYLGDINHGLFS